MLVGRLGRGAAGYYRRSFVGALCNREPLGALTPPGLEPLRGGEARGMLLGGTVTQLLASIGTPYAFDPPSGFVLFFDEVGDMPAEMGMPLRSRSVVQVKSPPPWRMESMTSSTLPAVPWCST